jgi:hypothetical protein
MDRCARCNTAILFGGIREEGQIFCGRLCFENHKYQGFCPSCVAETKDTSPGGTYTLNGIGTKLYGNYVKCPTCFSVIKRKWFCVLLIPVIPLSRYRIKFVSGNRYIGRLLSR